MTSSGILFWLPTALNSATVVVLVVTGLAVWKQATAAEKLTEATKQQIRANEASAKAASEQVEVARRQITESLRPILTFSVGQLAGSGQVKNEGCGAALDIWWTYGTWGEKITERFELGRRFAPPGEDLKFRFDKQKMEARGMLIVYRSLAGISSATTVKGAWNRPEFEYHPDVTEWDCKITTGFSGDSQ